ncbi:glycoside hydrolase [Piptocephalis cylindrospora]|uniref:chitinase n=1 Tax=Piptocephalis cylindrospora TaxID=1907219 RepID=A0A4P9Y5G8_9FUNG|nr:glycoside hydrolase [Piptocephalis cylindrospora]|eukprot:RKP14217.1 glycoside hydrolase [Piptocephalis cylindrospora]
MQSSFPRPRNGTVLAGYYTSWSIYARSFPPSSIPAANLSHLLYAFANVREDGTVFLSDAWADTDKHWEGDRWDEPGKNLYGNMKQLNLIKKKHPLKLTLSIGGWSFSSQFAQVTADPTKQRKFVTSAMTLLADLGLDGLDIDWEYPKSQGEGRQFLALLRDLRAALNDYAKQSGTPDNPYILTCAMPCGPQNYSLLPLQEMAQVVDLFYLMAYDFSGSWESTVGHQANLFGGSLSVASAVQYYLNARVPAHQLVLGIPLYGRAFENTNGIGSSFSGVGKGTWEAGIYDYKDLPKPGASVHEDLQMGASWSYDPQTRELVSYDTPAIINLKAQWARDLGLAGIMAWELSGDRPVQSGTNLLAVAQEAFAGGVDTSPPHLKYPFSHYDNVRNGL